MEPPGTVPEDVESGLLSDDVSREIGSAVTREIGSRVAANVLQASSEKARSLFDTYARVDLLRPYFDISPAELRSRLLLSMWPRLTADETPPVDLYGPVMICFTMSAILMMLMKTTVHGKQFTSSAEQTLMGTALASSFGYWATFSAILYTVGFIFNTALTGLELLTATGYAMFVYCIVLITGCPTFAGPAQLFTILWFSIGILSALRLAVLMRVKTQDRKQGLIVGGIAFAIHWLWLFRLHRVYTHR